MKTKGETLTFLNTINHIRDTKEHLEFMLNTFFGAEKHLEDSEYGDDWTGDDSYLYTTETPDTDDYIDIEIFYIKDKNGKVYVTEAQLLEYNVDILPKMLITESLVRDVISDYDYTELTEVYTLDNEDVKVVFNHADTQMDLIYAISGIIQSIIDKINLPMDYADIPWVDTTEKSIIVTFRAEDFTR